MAKTGDGESLGTAEGAVMGRATHTLHTESPVLNDTWAIDLLGPTSQAQARDPEHEPRTRKASGFDFRLILAVGIGSLRYAEDEVERCAARGVEQYAILGAGFDTFALRRNDLAGSVRVFEIDFPDVQALKRDRVKASGKIPAQHPTFVPVDFETMSVNEAMTAAGFDRSRASVWSWMNTIPYLTNEATESSLREIREIMAPGSRLLLNYSGEVPLTAEQAEYLARLGEITGGGGEPFKSKWKPEEFETLLDSCGYRVVEHATEVDLNERYYTGRTDGLFAGMPSRLITAEAKD